MICKFCGKECKNNNSLKQHEIRCKYNPNKIISNFVKYNEEVKLGLREKKNSNQFSKAKNLGLPKPEISDETRLKLINSAKLRKHSNETKKKISESYKLYLESHPEKVGFIINHSSKQSYPEKYFEELFIKENIPLFYHKYVGRYELDFYNDDLKKYVEIDGNQHYSENMIKHDKERTEYLFNLGWVGFRIKWSYYKSLDDEEKKKTINDIKNFLNIPS